MFPRLTLQVAIAWMSFNILQKYCGNEEGELANSDFQGMGDSTHTLKLFLCCTPS